MQNQIIIKISTCPKNDYEYHLPTTSQSINIFKNPLKLVATGPIQNGLPPKDFNGLTKVFVGEPQRWQNLEETMNAFGSVHLTV